MKLNQLIKGAILALVVGGLTGVPVSATKVLFGSVSQGCYLIENNTGKKIDFEIESFSDSKILDLTPGTFNFCGAHPNDRNDSIITFEFDVKPEEGFELKHAETYGDYHYMVTLGMGYYYLSQSYKDENNKSVSMRGGVDFTIDDIKLFDTEGKEVKFTSAPRYTNTTNEDRMDLKPSGYYVLGFQDYTTTATINPVKEKHPDLIPVEWNATLTNSVNAKSMTRMPEAISIVFTYPSTADGHVYLKKNETHYIPFDLIEPDSVSTENGITTKIYNVGKDSRSYNYRVSREGSITCANLFTTDKTPEINVTEEMLTSQKPDYFFHEVSAKEGNGTKYSDIFLNINQRHLLRLKKGDDYQIVNVRTWQLTNNSTSNYFIEPDYHWTVLNTDFKPDQSVVKVDNKGVLTAVAPGTAIVQVDYDAIRLNAMDGGLWSKLWAENMGTFVVTVDADESKAPADNIHLSYKANKPLDAEHDILYYMSTEPGYKLTFTPAEGSTVTVANPLVDTEKNTVSYPKAFSGENVTVNADGSVTVLLTFGRNIVRTTGANGASNFQVVSAKPMTCEMVTPRADGLVLPGDEITFKFDGLFHVAGKLAGIYNSNCHVRYNGISTLAGTLLGSGQYDFAGNQIAQSFTLTVPMDATDKVEITNGCLDPEGFGSSPGAHRQIDYKQGMNPNFNAGITSAEYGSLASQSAKVTPFDKVERLSVVTSMGKSVIPVREAVLKQVYGENIHWEIENPDFAMVNDVWAICPNKPGKTVAYLYSDATAQDSENARTPLLTCDVEIQAVEGYVPVESIEFGHTGDLVNKMNISWGNWGNRNYLSVTVKPDDATDKTVHLTSENPDMVTLGKKGYAEYDSNYCGLFWNLDNLPGESVVTARSTDGRLKISTVVRWMRCADSVKLDLTELDAEKGKSYQLTAAVSPAECSYPTVWTSSDESVVTVDDNGMVTAVGEGEATITAQAEGLYSPYKATCLVKVSGTSGISAVTADEAILSMHLNPGDDVLTINSAIDGAIDIYNLSGVRVLNGAVEAGVNHISLGHLNAGMYIVRIGNTSQKLLKR